MEGRQIRGDRGLAARHPRGRRFVHNGQIGGVVASAQGDIGAAQNRISYAQDNLKTSIQNYSAAESVIRDVDMADEMTKLTKNQILQQAGTAMLAQANQAPQSVLSLLR